MVRVLLHGGFDKLRSELEVGRRGCFRSTIRAYFSLCCAGWNVAGWNITMKNTSRRKNPKELLHPSPDDGSNSQTRELLQKAKEHLNGILTEEHLRDDRQKARDERAQVVAFAEPHADRTTNEHEA